MALYERWKLDNHSNEDNVLNLYSMIKYMLQKPFSGNDIVTNEDSEYIYFTVYNRRYGNKFSISYGKKSKTISYGYWNDSSKVLSSNFKLFIPFEDFSIFEIGTYLKVFK
jgi:hypothetical protein